MHKSTVQASLLALALLVMAALIPQRAAAAGYSVQVNGVTVPGAMAEMRNGQLMVSIRPFVEAMGGTVTWSQANQEATIGENGSQMSLWIGNSLVFQDGQRIWAPVAPYLKESRTMVPGWWLASRFGGDVRFTVDTLVVTMHAESQGSIYSHKLMNSNYYFPYPQGYHFDPYFDGYGDPRSYQGRGFAHEGIDILAPQGTPVVAVAAGTVIRYGWNTLGGYRLNIQLDDAPQYRFYYAHFDRYAPGIHQGSHVYAGQIIGYVGHTGEGPERTEGKFPPHLHFGIYSGDGSTIDPFPFLQQWEKHKARW
jgi:peptidoglycan LD-endopeptidase LytH